MIRILFLAANPTDQLRLQSRREFDQLRHALDATPHGRRFHLIQEFAVAADQLQELLVCHQPQIVHFSGHGSEDGLLFEAADGRSQRVAPATLRDLFAGFRQTVRCVLLNACYSQQHADAIATVIESVIGMSDALTDEAALAFATAFYRALANSASLADAVALGRNQLDLQGLDEAHKPRLLPDRSVTGQLHALAWDDDAATAATTSGATTTINSGGGTVIGHDLQMGTGDFINRNKVIIQQQTNIYQTVAAANQSVAGHESVVFVPFLRKSADEFVGRDAELVELHEKLQQSQMVGVRPAAALTGLGGIGKTQLAVEYAYRYQASYPGGIFWINAADLNRVRSASVETAERMGLRTDYNTSDNALLAALVKRCQQQPATLLCFDNAPDAVILWRRLTQELNTATLGAAILITTRRRELPPNMAALDLRRLSDDTVRQLLGTARPNLLTDPDLPRLLERLGGLPLVVSLVANALHNSPDATIADYLAALEQHGEEALHEELDVHVEDYDLYREVYTRTLLPVLREQWERLCQQPKSENAQLLLRIAGQLPEAAEIPIARLGLLAGLQDEKVIKPLTSAVNTLWKLTLVEELKEDTIRLHPLVRNFAESLTTIEGHEFFRIACAGRLASAFYDMQRLGLIYEQRGISAMILDLLTAIDFCHIKSAAYILPETYPPRSRPSNKGTLTSLYNFLHIFRYNAHHLQGPPQSWRAERLWQQLLLHIQMTENIGLTQSLTQRLRHTLHWLPHWDHKHQSAVEQTLAGHKSWVTGVGLLDSKRIISVSSDHTFKVWNLDTGTIEQTLSGHIGFRSILVVLDRHRIVFTENRNLKVWNLHTDSVEQTLEHHERFDVDTLAVLDAQHIVSASRYGTLKIWHLPTGNVRQVFTDYEHRFSGIAVLDAQHIISASRDGILKIWHVLTGTVEQTFVDGVKEITSVAALDEQRIIYCLSDGMAKVWNLRTHSIEHILVDQTNHVTSIAVLDAQRVVLGMSTGVLKIWDLHNRRVEKTFYGHSSSVDAMVVIDEQRIVSASSDHTLKVWNLYLDAVRLLPDRAEINGHNDKVNDLAVLEAQRIISASSDSTLKVWNLHTGRIEQTLIGHTDGVSSVAVLDVQRIVSGSSDGTFKVWNLHTGSAEQTFDSQTGRISDIAILDDNRIISASVDGYFFDNSVSSELKVWNRNNGIVEQTLINYANQVNEIAVLDANRIISASTDRRIRGSDRALIAWNLLTGKSEQTFTSHTDGVSSVAVLDAQHIISASIDHTIKIWNVYTGELMQTLNDNTVVTTVAVLNNQHIISGSFDGTLKVWNLQIGTAIASIGLDSIPICVAVVRQGSRTLIVAGGASGALYCLELVEPVAGN